MSKLKYLSILASIIMSGCALIDNTQPQTINIVGVGVQEHTTTIGSNSYTEISFNQMAKSLYINGKFIDGIPNSISNNLLISYDGQAPKEFKGKDDTLYILAAWNGNKLNSKPTQTSADCPSYRTNLHYNLTQFQTAIKKKYNLSILTNYNRIVMSNFSDSYTYKTKDEQGNWLTPTKECLINSIYKGIDELNTTNKDLLIVYLSTPTLDGNLIDNNYNTIGKKEFYEPFDHMERGRAWVIVDSDNAFTSFECPITNKDIMVWYTTSNQVQTISARGTEFSAQFQSILQDSSKLSYEDVLSQFTNRPVVIRNGVWKEDGKFNPMNEEVFK